MACASICDVDGATSSSCMVMREIQDVHDQWTSLRWLHAVADLITSGLQPRILVSWYHASDVIPAASLSREIFGPFSAVCLTMFLSNYHGYVKIFPFSTTKMEELTAGLDEKKKHRIPAGWSIPGFFQILIRGSNLSATKPRQDKRANNYHQAVSSSFIRPSCQFCFGGKGENLIRNDPGKSELSINWLHTV